MKQKRDENEMDLNVSIAWIFNSNRSFEFKSRLLERIYNGNAFDWTECHYVFEWMLTMRNSFPANFKCYASKMTRKFDKIYFDILACGWMRREKWKKKKKERLIEKCYYNFRTSINFARMKNGKMKKRMENWKF